jgi:hypothetical protein
MRREKEAPVGFDIDNYSTNLGKVPEGMTARADAPALKPKTRFVSASGQ